MTWQIKTWDWGSPKTTEGNEKTSSASISAIAHFTAGALTVLGITFDNASATTPTVLSIGKPAGETATWTRLAQVDSNQSGGGGGVRSEIWGIPATVSADNQAVTITLSQAVSAKSWGFLQFAGGPTTLTTRGSGGVTAASAINTTITQLTGTTPMVGDLVLAIRGQEGADVTVFEDAGTWRGTGGTTSGQGASSNLSMLVMSKVADVAGDASLTYTYAGDKGLAVAVLPAGPAAPPANFGGTGTLEAHKTRYPDLVLLTNPAPHFYYRFNERPETVQLDPSYLSTSAGTTGGVYMHDESIYHRDQMVFPANAGGAYTPGAPMPCGELGVTTQGYTRERAMKTLGHPGLGWGGDTLTDTSFNPWRAQLATGATGTDGPVIKINDATMDLVGGGRFYPGESGPRWFTIAAMIHLEAYPDSDDTQGWTWGNLFYSSRIQFSVLPSGSLQIRAHIGNTSYPYSNTQTWTVVDPTPLTLGRSYHVAATMDGTYLSIYVNGVLRVAQDIRYNNGSSLLTGEVVFLSGTGGTNADNRTWWEPGGEYLTGGKIRGFFDEWVFWKSGLSSTQIADLATAAFSEYVVPGKAWVGLNAPSYTPRLTALRPSYQLEVLGTAPAAYYRLGEAPGATTMLDSSGNARHGSYVGSPTLGVTGLLDGDNDTAMQPVEGAVSGGTVSGSWFFGTEFTWECVFYLPATTSGAGALLAGGTAGHRVEVGAGSGGGDVQWSLPTTSGSTYQLYVHYLTVNARHHLAAVRQGDTAWLYVDGEIRRKFTPPNSLTATSTTALTIGHDPASSAWTAGIPIDEVVIHSRALDAATIANRYAALSLPAPPSNVVSLGGPGALTATGGVVATSTATMSGGSDLHASAGQLFTGTAACSGPGTLTAAGLAGLTGFATWAAFGQLGIDAGVPGLTGAADFTTREGELTAYRSIQGGQTGTGSGTDDSAVRRSFWGKGTS